MQVVSVGLDTTCRPNFGSGLCVERFLFIHIHAHAFQILCPYLYRKEYVTFFMKQFTRLLNCVNSSGLEDFGVMCLLKKVTGRERINLYKLTFLTVKQTSDK